MMSLATLKESAFITDTSEGGYGVRSESRGGRAGQVSSFRREEEEDAPWVDEMTDGVRSRVSRAICLRPLSVPASGVGLVPVRKDKAVDNI